MSDLFYRNPRLLALTIGLILVSGISSYMVLPRMEDPLLAERVANINTFLPGADAERVESLVTEKLEEELREIEEIKEMRSNTRSGVSTISIELRDEVDEVDSVWSRVRDKLSDARPSLPAAATEPDFDQLAVRAYALIVALTWERDSAPNYAILRRLAEALEDRLLKVGGTEEVDTFGDPDEEILVEVSANRMASMGLTAADISRQIAASDAKVSAGQVRGPGGDLILEVAGELDTLERVSRTPIHYGADGSQFVPLSSLANVRKGIADPPRSLAIVDGRSAVSMGVLVRSRQRIDHWSREVAELLDDFRAELPAGVGLAVPFDQNRYVETRLSGLLFNLALSALAVTAVIFVLMGWRSAIIVGTALPLAGMMVLTGMRLLDIPIHQMSVTGLIIALGLLIDNAIVIVDEVTERIREGGSRSAAVRSAVRHLAVPLFGSTLTTALAFAPIALMDGPAGEFVGAISISVILAIASSFALAMTVIPALTALTRRAPSQQEGMVDRGRRRLWWRDGLSPMALARWYKASLQFVFRRPLAGIGLGVMLPVLGFVAARGLPEQFFPPADRDQIYIELELPPHASLADTLQTTQQISQYVKGREQVAQVHWFLGESGPTFYYNVIPRRKNTARYAQAMVQLRAADGARQLIHALQAELNREVPGARVLVRQLEQGPPFDAPVEVRIFGPDLDKLRELGDEVRALLVNTPHVIHTRAELSEALPKISLHVDEEQARLAGLDHAAIARQLNDTLEGTLGGSILEATEELPVRVRVSGAQRGQLAHVASIDLVSPTVAAESEGYRGIPLTAVSDMELSPEAATIPRLNGVRMNEVQAFITAGVLPAEVLGHFEAQVAAANLRWPQAYTMEFAGEAAKRDEAIGNLMANVSVLLVLMVATLVLSFGSFRIAGIVGAVAALSVGLGLGALWLFGFPFGFMAIVGTMGLIGVAINDAIVVLAALREEPEARAGEPVAVAQVVVRSTRHIVATSLTTMAGFTPLVISGGGFWPPMAIAIAGGVGGATILALYFVPAAYVLAMCRGGADCRARNDRLHLSQVANA